MTQQVKVPDTKFDPWIPPDGIDSHNLSSDYMYTVAGMPSHTKK